MLHRAGGIHPRPTGTRPAGPGAENDFHAKPVGGADRMGEVLLPRLAHEIDRPSRHADVHLQEEGLAQPRPVHGLQIGRHALPVLVAVHEIPINSRSGCIRRIKKSSHNPGGGASPRSAAFTALMPMPPSKTTERVRRLLAFFMKFIVFIIFAPLR